MKHPDRLHDGRLIKVVGATTPQQEAALQRVARVAGIQVVEVRGSAFVVIRGRQHIAVWTSRGLTKHVLGYLPIKDRGRWERGSWEPDGELVEDDRPE